MKHWIMICEDQELFRNYEKSQNHNILGIRFNGCDEPTHELDRRIDQNRPTITARHAGNTNGQLLSVQKDIRRHWAHRRKISFDQNSIAMVNTDRLFYR